MSPRADTSLPGLRGRWLLLARLAWVAVAVTVLAIVVFSVPGSFEHFRSVCTAAFETCSERAVGRPTPEGVRALQDAGLSLSTYALLNVVVDKVADFVWITIGALIFLRRSDDRMALLVSLFLVTFWTTGVNSTDARSCSPPSRPGGCLSRACRSWGWSAPRCSSFSSPADGLRRAGHAGSRLRSPLLKFPAFTFPSCTLVRLPWRQSHTWCSWGRW